MLELVLQTPTPPAPTLELALRLLGGVLAVQARLRLSDLRPRHKYLLAECKTKKPPRILQVEVDRLESRIVDLQRLQENSAEKAGACLDALFRLLSSGAIHTVELEPEKFAVAVRDPGRDDCQLRIVLVPERIRRFRVQIAALDPSNPHISLPRCYGELCNSYIDHSLDTGDLATLVLVIVAYLEMN